MLKSGMENKLLRGFVLGLFVCASNFSVAAENAGVVQSSRGTVTAKNSGAKRRLQRGEPVFVNDQIITADKSYVVLEFADGASITLLSSSAVLIEAYSYLVTDQDTAIFRLQSGGLRITAGAMAKSNPAGYRVRTPVALMVVRGPEFAVTLCGDQICTEGETQD